MMNGRCSGFPTGGGNSACGEKTAGFRTGKTTSFLPSPFEKGCVIAAHKKLEEDLDACGGSGGRQQRLLQSGQTGFVNGRKSAFRFSPRPGNPMPVTHGKSIADDGKIRRHQQIGTPALCNNFPEGARVRMARAISCGSRKQTEAKNSPPVRIPTAGCHEHGLLGGDARFLEIQQGTPCRSGFGHRKKERLKTFDGGKKTSGIHVGVAAIVHRADQSRLRIGIQLLPQGIGNTPGNQGR